MQDKIPITVIITTLNEEKNLPRCLSALQCFDEIIVVDSHSKDNSRMIAESFGARFVSFTWNGQYPKKRQWCLDNLTIQHDFVFFVDADEEVTKELADEIAVLDFSRAGYFIDGLYVADGVVLKRGMRNRKLCLINRHKMEFPVVDDLDIPGMGEIEGHYQPVLRSCAKGMKIGRLDAPLLHYCFNDAGRWEQKHHGYALWEKGMIDKKAYPDDPVAWRNRIKSLFRASRYKRWAFLFYYGLLRGGVLEGRKNIDLLFKKADYYRAIDTRK